MNYNLDKVYTNNKGLKLIKEEVHKHINIDEYYEIIDPCAGNGAFKTILPVTKQYDIEPDSGDIEKLDFFDLKLKYSDRLIVCSPPFGKDFELGKRFLEHASKMANTIVAIVSKKANLSELLPSYDLLSSKVFEGKCFTKNGEDIELKHILCIFHKIV